MAISSSTAQDTANKRRAAEAACHYVEEGMVLGVGTGSTVSQFINVLKARDLRLAGAVASSLDTASKLQEAGIEVIELNDAGDLALYVDGADEATDAGLLIKGGGAALTREKVIAAAAARFVCIVDESKMVQTLGAFPLPIEVIPMARSYVARQLVKMGGVPVWRQGVITDNGNVILDLHHIRLVDPKAVESQLNQIPGVVTVGLFAHRGADVLLIGGPQQVRTVTL